MKNLIILILLVAIGYLSFSALSKEEKYEYVDTENEVSVVAEGTTIDLSGQGLTKAPEYIFGKKGTEILDLSNNNLEGSLQAEIRHLSKLKVLNLSNNNFTGVPAEVGQLSNLEILNLSDNPITGLPNEIGNLGNLKVLDLSGTNYSTQDLETIRQNLSQTVEIKTN